MTKPNTNGLSYSHGRSCRCVSIYSPQLQPVLYLREQGPLLPTKQRRKKWIDQEFQPSVLNKDEQLAEMQWFINAAQPFDGMEINVLSRRYSDALL